MDLNERNDLVEVLVKNYIYEAEQNKIWQRESSRAYLLCLGRLSGVCMALNLDYDETDEEICVYTRKRRKVICTIKKNERST